MTGNPTNIVCWLQGGRYHDTVWGISYDRDNLLDDIEMYHYVNTEAERQGVNILGITETSVGDRLVTEQYELVYAQEQAPAFAVYLEETSKQWKKFQDNPEKFIGKFKRKKGYDLKELDPAKLRGPGRIVNLDQPQGDDDE
jgi:hypothetical protein